MDRVQVFPGAIPLETDLLNTNRNTMVALAKLSAAILGTSTIVNGLAVSPTGPASLQVSVAAGEIYAIANLDGTAYSSLAADTTHSILKQGISLDATLLTCNPPGTAGQSINYLIQVAYQDQDTDAVVLPYYNASNPAQAYSGPNNTVASNNTRRKGAVVMSAKAGTAATTGTQTTPAPDAGYVGLAVVTVANGQATITAGNITAYATAPTLPAAGLIAGGFQGNAFNTSAAGGTSDALTAAFTPPVSALVNGMSLYVRAASANATTTPSFTPNSGTITAKTIVKGNGLALVAGDIAGAGHWIELQYDATLDKWVLLNPATGVSSSSGLQPGDIVYTSSSTARPGTVKANGAALSRTTYAALFAKIGTTYGAGDGSTTFNVIDLRGEFVRGWDDGRGVDTGRTLGSSQADDFKSHVHGGVVTGSNSVSGPGGGWGGTAANSNTNATGGTETRPRNIALLACIAY